MIRRNLLRLRLETDRLVRSRALLARALGGYLEESAYADLIACLAPFMSGELQGLAQADLQALERDQGALEPIALGLFMRALGRSHARQELARSASLAVIGTSWTGEAAERLRSRYPDSTSFLDQLSWQGSGEVHPLSLRGDEALALAELARGAFFGVIAQLDVSWPPPRSTQRIWHAPLAGGAEIHTPTHLYTDLGVSS